MNTAWNGSAPEPRRRPGRSRRSRPGGRSRCGARRCRWRRSGAGRAGRRAPRSASRIMPAQVPKAGMPGRQPLAERRAQARRLSSSSDMVVDSPPGRIKPSTPARSAGRRTSTGWAPSSARTPACSRTSPCRASTPTLPPTWRDLPMAAIATSPDRPSWVSTSSDSSPRMASPEAAADLGHDGGVAEVGGGLDDGPGEAGRVGALEDARADEARPRRRAASPGRRRPAWRCRRRRTAAPAARPVSASSWTRPTGACSAWPSRTARPSRPG